MTGLFLMQMKHMSAMQGQLTVANGVLFGSTGVLQSNNVTDSALFALNTTDGDILTAVGLDAATVQNAPSLADNVIFQGTGKATPKHPWNCMLI